MKEIRFQTVLSISWRNVAIDINKVRALIHDFKTHKIQAAKARKEYAALKRVLIIDGDRFMAILSAAQKYNESAFKYWNLAELDAAYNEFITFFER